MLLYALTRPLQMIFLQLLTAKRLDLGRDKMAALNLVLLQFACLLPPTPTAKLHSAENIAQMFFAITA